MKKAIMTVIIIIVVIVIGLVWHGRSAEAPSNPTKASPARAASNHKSPSNKPTSFNKSQYSLTKSDSLWVIVNKHNPLNPKTYAPQLVIPTIPLRSNITYDEKHVSGAMAPTLEAMIGAAKQQGLTINLQSGYRSYQFQVSLYNRYAANEDQAKADTFSARPGYSEHQTGLAADLGGASNPACNVAQCFASTVEGKWLAANAYKYGFILRYPNGLDNITGYEYEPWHFRYVGKSLALQMHKKDIKTLEQFFNLPPAPNYK